MSWTELSEVAYRDPPVAVADLLATLTAVGGTIALVHGSFLSGNLLGIFVGIALLSTAGWLTLRQREAQRIVVVAPLGHRRGQDMDCRKGDRLAIHVRADPPVDILVKPTPLPDDDYDVQHDATRSVTECRRLYVIPQQGSWELVFLARPDAAGGDAPRPGTVEYTAVLSRSRYRSMLGHAGDAAARLRSVFPRRRAGSGSYLPGPFLQDADDAGGGKARARSKEEPYESDGADAAAR